MSSRTLAVLIAAGLAVTIGCSRRPVLIFFNNSPSAVTILKGWPNDQDIAIPPGQSVRTDLVWARGMTVRGNGQLRWYEGKRAPYEFWTHPVLSPDTELLLQIEPDGRIFVLRPGTPLPAREFPPQPEGFPLTFMRLDRS